MTDTVTFTQQLLNEWNLVLMTVIWSITALVRDRVIPEFFIKPAEGVPVYKTLLWRFLPLAPIFGCCVAYNIEGPWMPNLAELDFSSRMLLGVICGFATGQIHTLVHRILPDGPLKTLLGSLLPKSEPDNAK